jgi:cytochrome c biogenesis protein CcmG/thiol:disulfide interchange protein DsbE
MNTKVLALGALVTVPLIAVLAAGFQHDPHEIASPLVGRPAPDFSLVPLGGDAPVQLSALRGTPAVVNFWATWCVPCQQEHPGLLQVAQLYGEKVHFFGVVYQDEPTKIDAWLQRHGSAYPTLVDEGSRAAIAFGVYGVPETFVVDAAGTIVHKFTGPVDPNDLADLLDTLVTR